MTNREAFEKWWHSEFISTESLDWDGESYGDYDHDSLYRAWKASAELSEKRIAELEARNEIMKEALEHLAKLGNEPLYGTSEGNTIAKIALVRAERV